MKSLLGKLEMLAKKGWCSCYGGQKEKEEEGLIATGRWGGGDGFKSL